MSRLIAVLVVGRLIVWTLQTSGLIRPIWQRHWLLAELGDCDFCLGTWVFAFLAWQSRLILFEPYWHVPILSEMLTGLVMSYGIHLARVGWNTQYGTLEP